MAKRNLEDNGYTGFAYAEENNPNPPLFEITRRLTNQRLSEQVRDEVITPLSTPTLIQVPSAESLENAQK